MIAKNKLLLVVLLGLFVQTKGQDECFIPDAEGDDRFLYGIFQPNFLWGFATASYQIEGGWDSDGKGENIWDRFTHTLDENNHNPISDNSTGDIACDSYNKYREDVQMLKAIGANYYRFSLSWSRILPRGSLDVINQAGIEYYNNLIDELIANGIEPMITLCHWDLPQPLEDIGGWPNEAVVEMFENYARLAYGAFGDRVKYWITFNEAWVFCVQGYDYGGHAPGRRDPVGTYQCAHNVLKSHARAYRIHESEYKQRQGGVCGITIDSGWYEPEDPSNDEHVAAAERAIQFKHGWYASPVFFGKYPDVMREYVDRKSAEDGLPESRLPTFDAYWTQQINGSWDFLGLNHYTTEMVRPASGGSGSWGADQDTFIYQRDDWEGSASSWLKVVPWGFRKLLNWIKCTYGNPELMVTENGYSDNQTVGLEDTGRQRYYTNYINNMLKAVLLDGCNVISYTAWSLMDNFEWAMGYSERFGVHWVNFTDPARPRTPKGSANLLTRIFADNGFPIGA